MTQNDIEGRDVTKEIGKCRQFTAAIIMNMAALTVGVMAGWLSPMIPCLVDINSPVGGEPLTEDEISWLSSGINIASLLALAFCAWSCERFGRKITGYCLTVPSILNWLLIIFAKNFYYLLVARILVGFAAGLTFTLIPVYVAEISGETIRGQLGCYFGLAINLGILLAFVLGSTLTYHPFAICGLTLPVIFLAAFIFMPESPIYLIRKGRTEEGARSLMWLKSNDEPTVKNELLHLQQRALELSNSKTSVNLRDLFRNRGTIKAFIISLYLLTGQQTSGYSIVFNYTVTIFELANTSMDPNNAAILIAVIQVIGSSISMLVIERTGRRFLLLISCGGMAACHLLFAIFFLLHNQSYDLSSFSWLPVIALSSYAALYSVGLGPAAYVVAAEVLSPDIAALGISATMGPTTLMNFLIMKFFPFVTTNFGSHTSFFILSSFCTCTFLITFFILPETKGRSLESIFEELNSKPTNSSNHSAKTITKSN